MVDESLMSLDSDIGVEPMAAKDTDGVPYCRKHHCRMKQASGGKKGAPTSYFKCQVDGCDEKSQKIKTINEGVVPGQPLACPRCKTASGKPTFCERDIKSSTAASVILKCPSCGWKSTAMAVPQLAAAYFARRAAAPIEDIGSR